MTVTIEFKDIVQSIAAVHKELCSQVSRAVNVSITLRNWLIGCHIAVYELNGADRAQYGEGLLDKLSIELQKLNVSSTGKRQLYYYLKFYNTYPQIVRSLPPQLARSLPDGVVRFEEKVLSVTALSGIEPKILINRLSYTHIEQMLAIEDDVKRTFYEVECIQGNWSVRELKRQIHSLYFERCGLSIDKNKLSELTRQDAEKASPALTVRDPYVFEFLGLTPRDVMGESHLEDQLVDKLEEFLLELGHGFCFEARQKRILIGDEHYFVDLVFYHRILKCHILVELKLAEFTHENIGQLNTYVSWYRKNMMIEGDNPPIGILLCTHKNHSLVEYALAGMDNQLFVSKYLLELPKREDIERFLLDKLKEAEDADD